jgi:hypothetical protein
MRNANTIPQNTNKPRNKNASQFELKEEDHTRLFDDIPHNTFMYK